MNKLQYERWKDFSRRMAAHAFPRWTERRRARLRKEIEYWFEHVEDSADWGWGWEDIGSWDHESVEFRCRKAAEHFWKWFSDGGHGFGNVPYPWDNRFGPYVCDAFSDMFYEEFLPGYEDTDVAYEHAHFLTQLHCCIRAGLDIASEPSAGVVGFTVGDVKRMYDGTIPDWINEAYENDLNAVDEEEGIWL